MEKPYHRYLDSFIQHINQRQDILHAPVIQQFLNVKYFGPKKTKKLLTWDLLH